ncbi:hypothetical protein ACP70R_049056 [Stipagrostis hirtigluma subsp. patula]
MPLHQYEKQRLENIMKNNARMQSLGVTRIASILNELQKESRSGQITIAKNKGNYGEESGSEYDPHEDEGAETDEGEHVLIEVPKDDGRRSSRTKAKASNMAPGTKSKKTVLRSSSRLDECTRTTRSKSAALANGHMGGLIPTSTGQSLVHISQPTSGCNEGISAMLVDHTSNNAGQLGESNNLGSTDIIPIPRKRSGRQPTIGKGLDNWTRASGAKMTINIVEGKKRPEQPLQAAKLASECGIAVRNYVPIFPHWKEYKKDENKEVVTNYMDKVAVRFDMDVEDMAIKDACTDMLKNGVRQMRYRLKKHYFDGVPPNEVLAKCPPRVKPEVWANLVQKWSDPKHKETCTKNKENRGKVRLNQTTGSRSYIAHCYALREEKYKDGEPDAIDLFKECHCSKKKGFSEPAKQAIAAMEAIRDQPVAEGEEPKSATNIVSEVLSQFSETSKFLENVGILSGHKKTAQGATAGRIQELEEELRLEKEGAARLQEKVEAQQHELNLLKKLVEEGDESRKKQAEEMDLLNRRQAETEALVKHFLSLQSPRY